MNRLNKYLCYGCIGLTLFMSSCIRDGQDPCPPEEPNEYYSYIRFVYDYNMAFEDLFHKQVSKIDLYLFDEDGVYIEKLADESPAGTTFPKGYIMGLPEAYKAATQFVAFPGIHSDHGYATRMMPGVSTIRDLKVQLHEREKNILDTSLRPLWHGGITQYHTRVNRDDTTTISLTKNTNSLRIVLQSTVDTVKFDINEFQFSLEAVNDKYDAYNIPGDAKWTYRPFLQENNGKDTGGVVELHTLRLLDDRENRLIIRHLPTLTTVLNVNLNDYLDALKLQEYRRLTLQEYMDRECEYKLLVFLTPGPVTPTPDPDPDPDPEMTWIATQISINEWVVRDQPNEF